MNIATPNVGDEPSLANDPPVPEKIWLVYHYTKLGRLTYLGQWTPQYQNRDDLHTTTQNLADEPTLANGPPSTSAEMTWITLHNTWQMNLPWSMDPQYHSRDDLHTTTQYLADEPTLVEHNGKGLKALPFTISKIPHSIFSKHIFA